MSPDNAVGTIYDHALGALMAHTIRGVESHFLKAGVYLQVLVLNGPPVMFDRKKPLKSCLLTMTLKEPDLPDKRKRVQAKIYLRKGINHHLSRLGIAHELYHLILALKTYLASHRKTWDGSGNDAGETACNKFAQEVCRKHNKFNRDEEFRRKRIDFPDEIFVDGFVLDLSDFDALPACLRDPD